MSRAQGSPRPSRLRRLARLLRDLDARLEWHVFKVDFTEWAELGGLAERAGERRPGRHASRGRAPRAP
ncbi:hypothetical protein [Agrococcus baldri]|uniref:Uncharacterized protein n=1 Tax=Agrococcus baldri TaxID=153730 RepID=A0AA87RED6_9MICO|nr:hypothetical protein [Agrococcus baldri]GEK81171.1 hypothetical protein ABA31_25220 [Agrococcus baldri]